MQRFENKAISSKTKFAAATLLLALALPGQAFSMPKEVDLASPTEAMAFCKSGKMGANDIAYIAGAGGLAQFGPSQNCKQQLPTQPVKLAMETAGKHTKECTMVAAKKALTLCNDGDIGEYDIDYIAGPVGQTLSGPGYGCIVNFSSVSLGNAVCK